METPPNRTAPTDGQRGAIRFALPGALVGISIGSVIGFAIGASPGVAYMSTVPSVTFESWGFGLAVVLGLVGLAVIRKTPGPALLACAIALAAGTAVGVTARPTPQVDTSGSVKLEIDAVGISATVATTCSHASPDDQVSIWSDAPVAQVDGRDVTVRVWGSRDSGANLSLILSGVPDSSPFVAAREYTWSISSWAGSSRAPTIVLADMPMPTPIEVPNAPPMQASNVELGSHLTHGTFTFIGMRAGSADQPIGTWPLVLDGRLSWSCNQ